MISAVDNNSKEAYWEVIVKDELYSESQMQSVMPWLILSAQPYLILEEGRKERLLQTSRTPRQIRKNITWFGLIHTYG